MTSSNDMVNREALIFLEDNNMFSLSKTDKENPSELIRMDKLYEFPGVFSMFLNSFANLEKKFQYWPITILFSYFF